MSFIRPEASAALWRWREVLGGTLALVLGAYWITSAAGLFYWVGWAVTALGAAWIGVGIPRGRFRGPHGGPGIVQVVEGQVSYFGPLTGGVIDLEDLDRLSHDATGYPAHWRLEARDAPPLHIPVTAGGAEALFDAFQTLPGLQTRTLLDAQRSDDGQRLVWHRPH